MASVTAQEMRDTANNCAARREPLTAAMLRYAAGLVAELEDLKRRVLYANSTTASHSTACLIWGNTGGQDHTEPHGNCNCGALVNFERQRAVSAEAALAALRAVIQQELDNELNGFTGPCEIAGSLGRIVEAAGLWPKGEQVPDYKQTLSGDRKQVVFTPDAKLHAAADVERVLADVPDMLRAEFDVVKKAIAMAEARQKVWEPATFTTKASEVRWLGDLLAVLRGGE